MTALVAKQRADGVVVWVDGANHVRRRGQKGVP